jgi:hypothetical protein
VVGVGDFFGTGTDDILFRNNTTGDTWFEAISNGASAGWNPVGGSDTNYAVVGVGDYFGNNTSGFQRNGWAAAYRCGHPPTEQSPGLGTSLFGGGGTDGGGEVLGVPPAHSGRYSPKLNFVEQADSRAAVNITTIKRCMAAQL